MAGLGAESPAEPWGAVVSQPSSGFGASRGDFRDILLMDVGPSTPVSVAQRTTSTEPLPAEAAAMAGTERGFIETRITRDRRTGPG